MMLLQVIFTDKEISLKLSAELFMEMQMEIQAAATLLTDCKFWLKVISMSNSFI